VCSSDLLRTALARNPMIEESSIDEDGRGLVVTVKERVPVYLMAVRRGGEIIPFEADERFNVVSVRGVHLEGKPLVIIRGDELKGGAVSARVRDFYRAMSLLERENRELFAEISEIGLENDNMLEIFLKGRKTKISVKNDGPSFSALGCLVAVLDGRNYYPSTLRVGDGYGVIE